MSTKKVLLVVFASNLLLIAAIFGLVYFTDTAQAQHAASPQASVGTAFTYQGRLEDASGPVDGSCDFRFALFGSLSGSDQIGSTQTHNDVVLDDGYFSVALDFGENRFNGEARYLAIEVDCGSGFSPLTPRVALNPAPYALALPGLWTQQNITSPNVIGGFSGNLVNTGIPGATISGGGRNGLINHVTSQFGTISGGENNLAGSWAAIGGGRSNEAPEVYATIAGGYRNDARMDAFVGGGIDNDAFGTGSVIGGGEDNTANGEYATISGGLDNSAAYTATVVGGGSSNEATSMYATVPGGANAKASQWGQLAYASGMFAANGDAQTSVFVLRGVTSNSSWNNLSLDGLTQSITLANNQTTTFDILVVGRSDAGESAGFYIWGVAENAGGNITVWAYTTKLADEDGNWNAQAIEDDFFNALQVQVIGNGENIRWVATVRTADVAW